MNETAVQPAPTTDILERFSPASREWFRSSFAEPTPAQAQAWEAIGSGEHTLVVAPTGSGKTLSAFMWALDRLTREPRPADPQAGCRVLYVSPLKALAVDVERNLRSPLVGIAQAAERLGEPSVDVSVAVRSGDTPADERRAFARRPSDILITTPESLFLMLTSRAREALAGVETVIVDEVHAVAGTKRGAHLAVTLARLDAMLDRPAQRIGLSATVRPAGEVGRFLTGGPPVRIVRPESRKDWDLDVVVPVPDLAEMGAPSDDLAGAAAGPEARTSIWPHVESRIVDLALEQRSTLVFVNSRRLAERLTARLNEIYEERLAAAESSPDPEGDDPGPPDADAGTGAGAETPETSPADAPTRSRRPAAQLLASGLAHGAPPVLARAHHGSVSKEQRAIVEDELKSGRLPVVVATSSLELGIDMGAVDLVVQVESPPTVSGALQRVGRAGHQVGAVSRGVFFPKYRGDLVQTSVVAERMRTGRIEAITVPSTPLDVLAQQVVAMCALDSWEVDDLLALLRRTAPFAGLSRPVLESVLDMLAGRYPSEDFAELRPRIVWDRATDTLTGRPGAQRLAVTSGGTIPDRGLFGVYLAGGEGPGRRVGELDEEMVYESRVGDFFTLGTSTWQIEDITHDRVLVTPAPGAPGRLPFWKGDTLGRSAELGAAVGTFVRELGAAPPDAARERLASSGLDDWAADNLLAYLAEQREATGVLPDDRRIVVERFRDELGDWRLAVHSPFGGRVHAPWALLVAERLHRLLGVDVQAMHADDGIVLRLPDVEAGDDEAAWWREVHEALFPPADEVTSMVTELVGSSALFASRFRECAARALLLPRRNPGQRQALWQQRQRSAHLLEVAAGFPEFPIVLEAVRECVQDVFDVPALVDLLRGTEERRVEVVDLETPRPSPFARSLLFGYVAQFLYEGDSPLAERRAAALALDPELLAELLGTHETALRDLLDPDVVDELERELQRLAPDRAARDAEDVVDLLRRLGPLGADEIAERTRPELREQVPGWLTRLEAERRLLPVRIAGEQRHAVIEDAGRLRDALGVALPVGIPAAHLDGGSDPLGDLVTRYARTHGPFTAAQVAGRLGLGTAVALAVLRRLVAAGRLVEGELRPLRGGEAGQTAPEYCDAEVVRRLRRRSLAALRSEVEPVAPGDLARFLPAWQGVGSGARGVDALARVVEQLAGAVVPASALETLILPARVEGYTPHLLDELTSTGEVLWQGHGAIAGGDGWVSLHLADTAPLTLAPPTPRDRDAMPPGEASTGETATGGESTGGSTGGESTGESTGGASTGEESTGRATTGAASTGEGSDRPPAGDEPDARAARVLATLEGGGGWFFGALADRLPDIPPAELEALLWRLVWEGRVTNDGFAPVRALVGRAGGTHRTKRSTPRHRRLGRGFSGASGLGGLRPPSLDRHGPGAGTRSGRWSLLPAPVADPTALAAARAELLLDRHGVVTRGAVGAEGVPGGFAGVYRVLAAAEEAGRVRRGYLVDGLGAAQFATAGAIDRLRAGARPEGDDDLARRPAAVVLAAADPANPFGAALPWPERSSATTAGAAGADGIVERAERPPDDGSERVPAGRDSGREGSERPARQADDPERGDSQHRDSGRGAGRPATGHRPSRRAGGLVVVRDGRLLAYLERGGRSVLTWSDDPDDAAAAAAALAGAVRSGAVDRLTIERIDSEPALGSDRPLAEALVEAGFHTAPRGLRMRR